MTLNQLRYYCSAYVHRSITKAAHHLFVSQPTVTMAIKELEEEMRVQFFVRKNNRITPTREGDIFYDKARNLLEHADTIKQEMHVLAEKDSIVHIGIPYITAVYLIPEFRRFEREFCLKYPRIQMQLTEENPENIANLLQTDKLDLAVDVLNDPYFAQFEGMMLCEQRIFLCVSRRHPLAREKLITPDMLAGQILATNYSENAYPNMKIKQWFQNAGCNPQDQMRLHQVSTLVKLISNNEVIALLRPEMMMLGEDIVCIPLKDPIYLKLSIHWRHHRRMNGTLAIFLDELSKFQFNTWK